MSLNNLPISRKLMLAFTVVFLAIGGMGLTIFLNLQALSQAGVERADANAVNRATASAEFYLTKQEASFRGFLLSGDQYYLDRLDAHRANFKARLKEVQTLGDAQVDAQAVAAETAGDEWYASVVETGAALARHPATHSQAVEMVGRSGTADEVISKVESAFEALGAINAKALADVREAQASATRTAGIALLVGLFAAGLISVLAGWMLSRAIGTPVVAMTSAMRRLAGGDNTVDIPAVGRKDELGQMAGAVQTFKEAAVEKIRLEGEAAEARRLADEERTRNEAEKARLAQEDAVTVAALGRGLEAMAQGDLTHRFTAEVAPRAEELKTNFNAAIQQLQTAMGVVVTNVSAIRSGAGEISQAADDLSRRTEQQAASLEETAAALDEITATVNRTASGARQASDTVQAAKGDAESSGVVVRDAVGAMGAIEKSAQEISQIIGVIDEIAFQTNLLALNAGVEAARAGDAGRGFAVVASEVRALAQRSAEAAKEIKVLISASTTQVNSGVSLVGQTGEALQRIVSRVAEIDSLVSEIAASAQEQATGLQQVNTAVNQMDQVTQQNAAMVEESTAASHSLAQEAEALAGSVARFKIGVQAEAARAAPKPAHRPVTALKTVGRGGAALKPQMAAAEDGWEEF
ncbi:methyl-accepting chemotaxis protein [Roseibacterium beibuensis]|uniref:methyl-accepting chemotaxis protein n=1 Tax=[Roseibacterium] beibuensis TaxID=1193142 RepID=UPI00217D5B1B|nr:methyl-accepting chemotaxis protein [Roseibacterium beibuensis]MCS6627096.1 methyl-accepting chemotaxis protein [Roseibacterium beibuensis]